MVKYGYSSITQERTYYEYICEHCGKHLGAIEIVREDGREIVQDDIIGWNFCPYCSEALWDGKVYKY